MNRWRPPAPEAARLMILSLPEILPSLRCPASGEPLELHGEDRLSTPDGGHSYPIYDGVAVLVDEEKSLFVDVRPPQAPLRSARLRARAKNVARWILYSPPTGSRNVTAKENYREMIALVHRRAAEQGRPVRLLVVGGAVMGAGAEEILTDPKLQLVETDVYFGPRVGIIADGHDLPFADGSFDAVICQAVLEHVIDPWRVAQEIWRVLTPNGYLYSDIPFMQQVHGGAFDFTRFSLLGHRRLWRYFDEIHSGASGGPGVALIWSIQYFMRSLMPERLTPIACRLTTLAFFWLKYFDDRLVHRPVGEDAASGTFFLGRRRETAINDRTIVRGYRGAGEKLN
jgi:SAM-dependent methyltransferase